MCLLGREGYGYNTLLDYIKKTSKIVEMKQQFSYLMTLSCKRLMLHIHQKPEMINRKTVAVSIAQYYIMGNIQDQKTQFFNLVQSGDKPNMFSLEYRLCIAN